MPRIKRVQPREGALAATIDVASSFDDHEGVGVVNASLEPTPEQVAALAQRPADEPVVMINLLKSKADGGRGSYLRYTQEVAPHLQRVGGTVRHAGASPGQVIGDGEKPWWDAIIVVEYPSPAAFLDMVSNEEYLKVHEYRAAGLDRGALIATSIWTLAD
jgi:uncharacterized protein (DUF1330 family)